MIGSIVNAIRKRFIVKEVRTENVPIMEGQYLQGKKALIIGGSGGIGSEIAALFLKNGCQIIITGTNEKKLQSYCDMFGDNITYIILDLKNISAIDSKIEEAVNRLGRIDILVNAAGVHCHNSFGNIKEETWDEVLDINLKGMYFVSQSVANYMIANNIKGHILNVSSASCAKPGWTPYEISKWGVRSMTLGFADKLAPHGIIVNSIAPGPVATGMLGKDKHDNLYWPGNPTGRMASVEEIANLAMFMVSDMGNLIVGDTYFISGGSGTICIDR